MAVDDGEPEIGQEWVYCLRDDSPVERVRIDGIHRARPVRYDITFLGGDSADEQLSVPRRRLRVPWAQAGEFERRRSDWARVDSVELTRPEEAAVEQVFLLIVPREVADSCASPRCTGVTRIWKRPALERLAGIPIAQFTEGLEWFEDDDSLVVSAEGGLLLARALCEQHAGVVLDWVHQAEERRRDECRHGAWERGQEAPTRPEDEWRLYRDYDRHMYELMRQWCGHRAISARERLVAAEEEAHRLDELLTRCLTRLAESRPDVAAAFRRERDSKRVTPENVRPVVGPPLPPRARPDSLVRRRWP